MLCVVVSCSLDPKPDADVDPDRAGETGTTSPEPDTADDSGEDSADPGDSEILTAEAVRAAGAHPVGARTESFVLRGGASTQLEVWFPAASADGELHSYRTGDFAFTGGALGGVGPDCAESRPVVVHSHGNGSIRWETLWLSEHLASHGWVVLAVDHAGNTFEDGSADYSDLLSRRPTDVADSFDWLLEQSANTESDLYGCIDPDAGYAVSGYSFGGYTAYVVGGALVDDASGTPALSFADPRAQAVVALAPWTAGVLSTGTSAVSVPALTIGAERDQTVGRQYLRLHTNLTVVPRVLGIYPDAGHFSVTPIYCDFGTFGDGCGDGWVSLDTFVETARGAIAAWLYEVQRDQSARAAFDAVDGIVTWELEDSAP